MNSRTICPACGSAALREIDPKTGEADVARRCTGTSGLSGAGGGETAPFLLAQRLRHRGPRRQADRVFLRERPDPHASRYFHACRSATRHSLTRIENFEGFGKVSTRKLFDAIEARREIVLNRFIFALGIRHVGETNAIRLARSFETFEALREAAREARTGSEAREKDQRHRRDRRGRRRGGRRFLHRAA